MKRFWMALAWLAALPLAAHADTITVGEKRLSYQAPQEYVVASKSKYSMPLSVLRKALPAETVIHEVYIEKRIDAEYGKKANLLDDYIVITSHRKSDGFLVSLSDFKKLKDQITKIQETRLTTSLKDHTNERLNEVTQGVISIGNVRPMGILASTDTQLSFMALMSQSVKTQAKNTEFDQAFVSTTLLAESKVISINHYRTIYAEEEIDAFRTDALAAVNSMNFTQGPAAGVTETRAASSSAAASPALSSGASGRPSKSMTRIITTTVIGALIGGLVLLFRRRRAKKAQVPQAAPPAGVASRNPFPTGNEGTFTPDKDNPFPSGGDVNSVTAVKIGENRVKKDDDPFDPTPLT